MLEELLRGLALFMAFLPFTIGALIPLFDDEQIRINDLFNKSEENSEADDVD